PAQRHHPHGAGKGPPGDRGGGLRHRQDGGRQADDGRRQALPGPESEPARGQEVGGLDQVEPRALMLAVAIDGLIYASWLFLIALGLTLIYGVMRILNMAHGSLYALGAYAAASLAGRWLAGGHAPLGSYAVLIAAAVLVGILAGPLIERGVLRAVYGRDEIVLVLVTYALFLILEDAIKLAWG